MRISLIFTFLFIQSLVYGQVTQLDLLAQWSDSTLVGSSRYNNTYNEVWGVAIDGREYAIIGSTFGTHILDVTDPSTPIEVVRIPGKDQGPQIIHRDYHDYGCYLYAVSDEGASSLQIIDLSQLPEAAPVVYDDNALISRSHNIFIDSSSAKLYSLATRGVNTGAGALQIFDLADPTDPVFLGTHNRFGNINAGHVHDGYVINDTAYLNCGFDGLAIVDFSDPKNPVAINTLLRSEYPFSGYNHSCWRSDDGSALYMADETWDAPMKVINLENHADLEVEGVIDAGNDNPFSIPHNQVVACNYLYVSYYYDGLQVFDISDPLNPVRSFFYPTSQIDPRRNYEGAWGVYPLLPSGNILVSDMQEGLFIVEAINSNCNDVESCPSTTNTTNRSIQEWTIQPNPAIEYVQVECSKGGSARITDLYGRTVKVLQLKAGVNNVRIDNLPSGAFVFNFEDESKPLIKL